MTATVIPLELVYEHRNYFASYAIALILIDSLQLTNYRRVAAYMGFTLSAALIGFAAVTTYLRANEWSNPVRFSISEASKHPQSPRAQYDLARTFVVLSNYEATSPFFNQAMTALERAAAIPNSNILPEQGLLMFAARSGTPQNPSWWSALRAKLGTLPMSVQDVSALNSLELCQQAALCDFERDEMLSTFTTAVDSHPDQIDVLTIFSNYALNVMHDLPLALRLAEGATELAPKKSQYVENLAKLLIAEEKYDRAETEIEELRRLNRLGTLDTRIVILEDRLSSARKAIVR